MQIKITIQCIGIYYNFLLLMLIYVQLLIVRICSYSLLYSQTHQLRQNNVSIQPTWNQYLLVSPIVLLLMITSKWIDNSHHTWFSTTTYKIKIQHTLNGSALHTPHYRFGIHRKQWCLYFITITLSIIYKTILVK